MHIEIRSHIRFAIQLESIEGHSKKQKTFRAARSPPVSLDSIVSDLGEGPYVTGPRALSTDQTPVTPPPVDVLGDAGIDESKEGYESDLAELEFVRDPLNVVAM
jgi:hypothetical protein